MELDRSFRNSADTQQKRRGLSPAFYFFGDAGVVFFQRKRSETLKVSAPSRERYFPRRGVVAPPLFFGLPTLFGGVNRFDGSDARL